MPVHISENWFSPCYNNSSHQTTGQTAAREPGRYHGRVAVVMGNERRGISRDWQEARDMSVAILMHGRADSLNVGNTAVLLLYEVTYQQQPAQWERSEAAS